MKEKRTSRCIHCLAETEYTRDHVFPKHWYPDTTPDHIQRPVAPACSTCNNFLGKLESILFKKLALCIDHAKPEVSGIKNKLFTDLGFGVDMRLLKPKKIEEIKLRRRAAEKLLASTKPYDGKGKAFPGLGGPVGYPSGELRYFLVPDRELLPVCEKIIRGLEYVYKGRYLEAPYRLEIHFVDEVADISSVETMFSTRLPETVGPGFKVERLSAREDQDTVLYRVTVWGTIAIYGAIMPDSIPPRGQSYGKSVSNAKY